MKMNEEDLKMYINKKIKIFLKNNLHFTGKIEDLNNKKVIFRDKFGKSVILNLDIIDLIIEIGDSYE
jgi:sRNA-binding regulator protein Hfq